MKTKFVIFVIISSLLVAAIYSSILSVVFATKARSKTLCEKSTANGITTETCCFLETDSKTEKTTQYCTECKTTSSGADMGCTHSQTDVSLTLHQGMLDIKPLNPPQSTEQLPNDTKVAKDFGALNDGDLMKGDDSGSNDTMNSSAFVVNKPGYCYTNCWKDNSSAGEKTR